MRCIHTKPISAVTSRANLAALRMVMLLGISSIAATSSAGDRSGVIRLASSLNAKLHNGPIDSVSLTDVFWNSRLEANRTDALPAFYQQLERAGAIAKIRGKLNRARGNSDADVAKWMEAASYVVHRPGDGEVNRLLAEVVSAAGEAIRPGGYLHDRYLVGLPKRVASVRAGGELYCLGHWIQASLAYARATGNTELLDFFRRCVEANLARTDLDSPAFSVSHPVLEMALVELYRETGEKRYLRFARYLLDGVDLRQVKNGAGEIDYAHLFTGIPFTTRKEISGHAVCALYAASGAADYFLETGDTRFGSALDRLWRDLTHRKMYVTGGVGSVPREEEIGRPYYLPNETAYAETCAAVGQILWNWRMLHATGDARYTDVLERVLYNGFLSGVALQGDRYFYWNPLLSRAAKTKALAEAERDGESLISIKKSRGVGVNIRQSYYRTPCCPPNAQRLLASFPGYLYSTGSRGIWVHLYASSAFRAPIADAGRVTLKQQTSYPWDGLVELKVDPVKSGRFSLFLRIPSWTSATTLRVNGDRIEEALHPGTYFEVNRAWEPGDRVTLDLPMPVQLIQADPRIRSNAGKVAIQRGPLIYCLEGIDHEGISIFDLVLPLGSDDLTAGFEREYRPELLGGVTEVTGEAWLLNDEESTQPYHRFGAKPQRGRPVRFTAIPYHAWANRGIADMRVWIPWVPAVRAGSGSWE